MIKAIASRTLLCGALAVAGSLASLQPAEAGIARVRFTPPYGEPFPQLEWFGEAVIDDGNCNASGAVSNLVGACAGQFSFLSATVNFAKVGTDISNPANVLQTLNFNGGLVMEVDRDSPAPPDWREIISTPFNTEQGSIPETLYDPDGPDGSKPAAQAYFSLIFIGGYAQLYWFQNDPGDFYDPLDLSPVQWPNAAYYALCYAAGPGDHKVGSRMLGVPYNRCGLSSNLDGDANGARLFGFEDASFVPEPGTLALVLAGLGAVGLKSRRRGQLASDRASV